jgi:hypothetical protein
MEILDDEEQNDIVSWLPHGQGFMIYKKKAFEVNVMSRFFKQSKFTSFTRKLNRWGFTRVTRGPETGAYYHKFFKRGQTRLCLQMSCQSSKAQPETWMKPQPGMMAGQPAPQMGGLLLPGLNPVGSFMGAAAAAAGSNALLQQQLLQLQQQQALQQLQQQELLRRAMASQTSNSLYLQLLQGKAASGGMSSDPMLMAQLQSTARNAAATANNQMTFGAAMASQQQQQQDRSDNGGNVGSPDSTRSAGEIRRALAA